MRSGSRNPTAWTGRRPIGSERGMGDHYDPLETRDPAEREEAQSAALSELIACAMAAPGWAKHLAGVEPAGASSRADLARLPLLRKSDLMALQKAAPPFGGF